jgi:hypothetical protein
MRVSQDAAGNFIRLYLQLLHYAGQRREVLSSDMSLEDFIEEPLELKVDCRDAIYTPSSLLDDFLAEQEGDLSTEEQNIVRAWKRYVSGRFIVLRHLKKHTIFLDSASPTNAYGVLGLIDDLVEIFPKYVLPTFVETVLLPYEGVVVCDGLFRGYAITIGSNMRRGMNEDYKAIKDSERLITAL